MHSYDISRWAFTLADEPDAWAKGFDDSSWRQVTVPHDWSVEQPFSQSLSSGTGYLPGGIGWYRAHVPLADVGEIAGKHVRLVFHGVYKNADVWVNGYHFGSRPSGYAEFSFDLTEVLSYPNDGELVVSVRVEHTDISDSRWYNGSGITRRVELEVHEPVRVAEYGTAFTTSSERCRYVHSQRATYNHRPHQPPSRRSMPPRASTRRPRWRHHRRRPGRRRHRAVHP